MTMMRWDPFGDWMIDWLQQSRRGTGTGRRLMPMDVYRMGDEYVVEMDLPGVDPSSIEVHTEQNTLTVSAEAQSTHEQADEQILCERSHARFHRQLYLGEGLQTDKLTASFDNGVLTLRIPLAERQKARKVDVITGTAPRQIPTDS
jgi:HSP20 family protein